MNDLLMEYIDGRWFARVSNVDIVYAFRYLAEEPDLSSVCVQSLAMAMKAGRQQVIDSIAANGIFDLPGNVLPQDVVATLFDATQSLVSGGVPIFTAETVLADELDGAGDAMLTLIV
jgi:hypothetical protein